MRAGDVIVAFEKRKVLREIGKNIKAPVEFLVDRAELMGFYAPKIFGGKLDVSSIAIAKDKATAIVQVAKKKIEIEFSKTKSGWKIVMGDEFWTKKH